MRKVLLIALLIILVAPLVAEDGGREIKTIQIRSEDLSGKAKLGFAFGYPTGIVLGYRVSPVTEFNLFAGSYLETGLALGASMMFTYAELDFEGAFFPLSLGPGVFVRLDASVALAAMFMFRSEYDFKEFPLNLYLEAGPGLALLPDLRFDWTASLGIRYVF